MTGKVYPFWLLVLVTLLIGSSASTHSATLAQSGGGASPQAVVSPLLQYQGRLTDPGSGRALDGVYEMSFRLYSGESGGSALWTETKDVQVQGGVFSTRLGDTTALNPTLFRGQVLWLGIKVGSDAEATPRQQILPVAYALSLMPGAVVESGGGPALELVHTSGGEALRVRGNLNVSGSLTGGSHSHSGEQITSGSVADGVIAATLARDSEIWPAVLARDGAGSTLDADLLDGSHASAFAAAAHTHSGLLLKASSLNVNCAGADSFSTSWTKIVDIGTFTKVDPGSSLEITFNGRISAQTIRGTGAKFEIRIDNAATTSGYIRASLRAGDAGSDGLPVSMTGFFNGLGTGVHTVSMWVMGSYDGGTQAYVDSGCWSSDHVVIREFR